MSDYEERALELARAAVKALERIADSLSLIATRLRLMLEFKYGEEDED